MLVEILSHDTETFKAEIKFTHNGVVVQDKYDLLLVEPTMKKTLESAGLAFTFEMQQAVIEKLTGWIQNGINAGGIKNHHSEAP
jgi:hypothetical protein